MDSLELNKIAAAILTAGVVAMLSGFVAGFVVHVPEAPEERAYVIATPEENGAVAEAEAPEPVEESVLVLLASADPAAGESVTRKCTACHSFDEGGANRVGPNLWDIVGSQIAAAEGFNYSDALAGRSSETWSYENLDAFLASPRGWAPGTKMAYAGLRKASDRAELIAYLRGLSNDPQPLPEAEPAPEPSAAVEPAAETVVEAAGEIVTETAAEVSEAATEAGEAIAEAASEAAETATEAGEALAEAAAETAETAAETAAEVVEGATEAAETAAETVAGAVEAPTAADGAATEAATAADPAATQAAAAPASALAALIAAADPADGQKVARKCRACHTFDSGGANRVGPALWGILGQPIAGVEGYNYSAAFQEKAGETWTYDNMAAFLAKPREWVPGTKMAFAGLRKEEEIAALLAYLREQHDNPPALPE